MSPVRAMLEQVEEYVIGVCLLIMLAIVFLNAISRYLVSLDLAFALEIVTSLFPWITFLGGAVAVKRKGHVAFSLLTDTFPRRVRKGMALFAFILAVGLYGVIAILGTQMVLFERETHQGTPALEMPTWIIELSIPLGSLAILARTVQVARQERRKA
jgi:TRAP-type C4-dicarboxylate transport system permease small subunit